MSAPRDWDAATYDRVSDPQVAWAQTLIERLRLQGDETVLDAGCGSGRVTRMILDQLPEGRVIAVDASPSMVELAAETLGHRGEAYVADLVELELPAPVDAVFSNAVFHWILDHDTLFGRLYDALAPGGRLTAQCGGLGNIDSFRQVAMQVGSEQPFAEHFEGWGGPWNYADPVQTAQRLAQVGFAEIATWLEPRPVDLDDPEPYVRSVCLGVHLDRLPADLHDSYVDRVLECCRDSEGHVELGYVRLNIDAVRPA